MLTLIHFYFYIRIAWDWNSILNSIETVTMPSSEINLHTIMAGVYFFLFEFVDSCKMKEFKWTIKMVKFLCNVDDIFQISIALRTVMQLILFNCFKCYLIFIKTKTRGFLIIENCEFLVLFPVAITISLVLVICIKFFFSRNVSCVCKILVGNVCN